MKKFAICDDVKEYIDIIKSVIDSELKDLLSEYVVDTYTSGEELISTLKEKKYDLIFLDINMPEISGFEVAQVIYDLTKSDNLVFVSSEEDLVFEAMDFRPLGFVRKSNLGEDIKKAIAKWYDRYGVMECLELNGVQTDIEIRDIMAIEVRGHYIDITLVNGKEHIRGKIKDLEYILKYDCFIKTQKSCIYNFNYIRGIDIDKLELANGDKVEIGRNVRKEFKERYKKYLRKMRR